MEWVRASTLAGLAAQGLALPLCHADAVSPEKRLTQLSIRRYGLEQGLPTISIGALAQDGEGTLWIGTGEGLVSFDGFDFTVFDRRNTPAFASNEVAALAFDSDGTLWIGMADGWLCRRGEGAVERVDRLAGRVVLRRHGRHVVVSADGQPFRRTGDRLTAEPSIRGAMPGATLTAIVADAARDTWISSLDGDFLARFRGGLRVPVEPAVPEFPGGPIDWLGADGKGAFWVVGRAGIHHVEGGRVRSYRPPPEMGGETFHGLLVDSADCLLFGFATRGGLARLCGEKLDVVGRGSGRARRRLRAHGGVLTRLASEPRLLAAFGLRSGPVPASTLRLRSRQLGLEGALLAARERDEVRLDEVLKALRDHGSGIRAATALGITRDALVWRLRCAGLSVRQVLGSEAPADEG